MSFDPIAKPPNLRTIALAVLGSMPLGCGEPAPPRTEPAPIVAPAPEAPVPAPPAVVEAPAELRAWLASQVVSPDDPLRERAILYTWTRAEQIAELRTHPQLLTRTHAADGSRSAFDAHLDGDPHPLARYLSRHPRAMRFAWTNPWATRRGWPDGDYGDRLIAIELRADAWIATFDATAEGDARWRVRTLSGEDVSADELARDPARVVAVLHVGRGVGPSGDERVFREVVVVSERGIKRWSIGTDEIMARLASDRARLASLADHLDRTHAAPDANAWAGALFDRWRTPAASDASVTELYDRALAMGSAEVRPDAAHIRAIAESLDVPTEAPLVHDVPHLEVIARRPPPPPAPPRSSVFVT